MKDFILAALPWIAIGLTFALYAVDYSKKKKAEKNKEEYYGTCMTECMCVGVCIGVLLGGYSVTYGMLIGTVAGMFIPKKKRNEK